jgi:hypothetical protein
MPRLRHLLAVPLLLALCPAPAGARTVHRCVRDGTVSLSTAPEPGSRCRAVVLDDASPRLPDLWRLPEGVQGKLYRRVQDGRTVYGTRELPGSVPVLAFSVPAPKDSPAHVGLGHAGTPRLAPYAAQFRATAAAIGIDDAWLRAIAHAESGFDAGALSPKGAQGLMQLMPATAAEYGVRDPYSSAESIRGGARLLKDLMRRYDNDLTLVAAAYNAGIGALARYGGVPPYAETQAYVAKVLALHGRYRRALAEQARRSPGADVN